MHKKSLKWTLIIFLTFIIGLTHVFGQTINSTKSIDNLKDEKQTVKHIDGSEIKAYQNDNYTFEIRYSKDFVAETNNLKFIKDSIVKLKLVNNQYYKGTNLIEASVIIGITNDKASLTNCLKGEAISLNKGEKLSEKRIINGITFYKDIVSEGAAGNLYEKISFRTIYERTCYEITFLIHSFNVGVLGDTIVTEFDKDKIYEKLNEVLSTFKFTN